MNIRLLVFIFLIATISYSVSAQQAVHTAVDSMVLVENVNAYTKHFKCGEYKAALPHWKYVYQHAPTYNKQLYIDGEGLYAWLITQQITHVICVDGTALPYENLSTAADYGGFKSWQFASPDSVKSCLATLEMLLTLRGKHFDLASMRDIGQKWTTIQQVFKPQKAIISQQEVQAFEKNLVTLLPVLTLDKLPTFLGGQTALQDYLKQAIRYPKKARRKKVEGRVLVSFVVQKDGTITKIQLKEGLNNIDYGLHKEALRVVNTMPNWVPGEVNGKKVAATVTLPFVFALK